MSFRLLITACLLLTTALHGYAQSDEDLRLIFSTKKVENNVSPELKKKKRIVPYLFKPGYLIFKNVFYHQMGMSCYFANECTVFCGNLIEEFGLLKGYFTSFDRVMRCNRFAPLESYPSALTDNGKVIEELESYKNQ